MSILTINNVGKAYSGSNNKFRTLTNLLFNRKESEEKLNWILQDINFEANPGDTIGIVGVNGAGKSTLLRMIAGNLEPTQGKVIVRGKMSAILELGMGFHPDFTGRQNVMLEGQLSGLNKSQINRLMPRIERFADIGEYFNQSINIYSSGMLARLAFAIVTANKPEILIIDEALSVGDLAFQAKCMKKMNDLKNSGTCILLVSHAPNIIRQFCDKAIYISQGTVRKYGSVDEVCDQYQNDLSNSSNKANTHQKTKINKQLTPSSWVKPDLRKYSIADESCGSLDLEFLSFEILNAEVLKIKQVSYDQEIIFKVDILANKNVKQGAAVGLLIADKMGYHLMSCNSNLYDKYLPALNKGDRVCISWSLKWPFQIGQFRIDIGMKPDPFDDQFYDRIFCAGMIESIASAELLKRNFGGYLFFDANLQISNIFN